MIDKNFSINNRFWVNVTLNLVKDLETNQEQRLEPRLMNVLYILAQHEGELVTRERLIAEVWNNYGGAEDGLNQAVSFLRKTLQDVNKEIIETVPKKGYILHANLNSEQHANPLISRKVKFNFKNVTIIVVAILAIFSIGYFSMNYKTKKAQKPNLSKTKVQESKDIKDSLEVNFSELNKPEEENYTNTITTTAPDGTKYRLVAIGDKRPRLFVNEKLISGPELEKYSEIEGQLLRQLWDRSKRVDTILNKSK